MRIVNRTHLVSWLTGPFMDPDRDAQEELAAIAKAILLDARYSYFVHNDSENGGDPHVAVDGFNWTKSDLFLMTNAADGSYYGVVKYQDSFGARHYECYLKGSALQSASGFTLSSAILAE